MENKLELIIVEDNFEERTNISNCINNSEDFILVGEASSAQKAVELIEEYLPDAVILDLELHEGSGDGLEVLKKIQESCINKHPYFLITTNNSSIIAHNAARQLGADFIISKHQNNYSAQYVLSHLRIVKDAILNTHKNSGLSAIESPEHYNRKITSLIQTELNLIGVNPRHKGYKYLTDAILFVIQNPNEDFYPVIAKKHKCTCGSVEHAMKYSINHTWNSSDIEDLYTYYTARINSERGCPTIMEFINFYANKINNLY